MTVTVFAMALVVFIGLTAFAYSCRLRYSILFEARGEDRFDQIPRRIGHLLTYVFAQKKLFKDFFPGLVHAIVFWGFCVLTIRSLNHVISGFTPGHFSLLMFWAPLDHAYAFLKDLTELAVLGGVIVFVWRRLVVKPERITQSNDALFVLALIGLLMLSDFISEGAAIAHGTAHGTYQPVSALFSLCYAKGSATAHTVSVIFYWLHVFIFFLFLNYLPYSKHMHVLTVMPNVLFDNLRDGRALRGIENIEAEFEKEEPKIGVKHLRDMSWIQILNVFSCTENGRCSTSCPAKATGKPLDPKKVMEDLKHYIEEVTVPWKANKIKEEEIKTVIEAIGEDVIWSCTTCGSCEENCPIMNGFVQNFVDMRRYLVMMESRFPKELTNTFKNLENKSNPWGLPVADREKWAEGLDVPKFTEQETAPEWLFWVGCAGAYDDRSKKTARALVEIFSQAGVSYGILGKDEGCTGDTARRLGNEYLFEVMAKANIELLNGAGVTRIITMCPHCLQTLGKEYGEFGGHYEVIHHSQLLEQLVDEGTITLKRGSRDSVVFHDSCYLGRYNKIYDAPRRVLRSLEGVELREIEQSRENGMCCGAGGGWAWMEEHEPRMNDLRTEQLLQSGASTMATACPFCKMMIADGVANKGQEEKVRVRDIAELVQENMDRAKEPTTTLMRAKGSSSAEA